MTTHTTRARAFEVPLLRWPARTAPFYRDTVIQTAVRRDPEIPELLRMNEALLQSGIGFLPDVMYTVRPIESSRHRPSEQKMSNKVMIEAFKPIQSYGAVQTVELLQYADPALLQQDLLDDMRFNHYQYIPVANIYAAHSDNPRYATISRLVQLSPTELLRSNHYSFHFRPAGRG